MGPIDGSSACPISMSFPFRTIAQLHAQWYFPNDTVQLISWLLGDAVHLLGPQPLPCLLWLSPPAVSFAYDLDDYRTEKVALIKQQIDARWRQLQF